MWIVASISACGCRSTCGRPLGRYFKVTSAGSVRKLFPRPASKTTNNFNTPFSSTIQENINDISLQRQSILNINNPRKIILMSHITGRIYLRADGRLLPDLHACELPLSSRERPGTARLDLQPRTILLLVIFGSVLLSVKIFECLS